MSWVAAAVAGGAIVGSYVSGNAAKDAANTQANASKSAADSSLAQFNTINSQQAPYRQSGYGALNALNTYLGIAPPSAVAPEQSQSNFDAAAYMAANPDVASNKKYGSNAWGHYVKYGQGEGRKFTGTKDYQNQYADYQKQLDLVSSGAYKSDPTYGQFTHQFNANDLNANLAPNYQFMLEQGLGQTKNLANSTGGVIGGNALQGLNTFAQNYSKNAYQDAFNNYTANQTNIFNRLASIAGLGQTSLNTTANAGTNATNSHNNFMTSAAAANAAGTVGQANAISSGVNTLANLYASGAAK